MKRAKKPATTKRSAKKRSVREVVEKDPGLHRFGKSRAIPQDFGPVPSFCFIGPVDPDPEIKSREPAFRVRFAATVLPGRKQRDPDWMNNLGVDRLPDPKGRVRVLLSPDDMERLLAEGFEIRLQQAYSVRPLDSELIETDDSVKRWLENQLRDVPRSAFASEHPEPER